MKGYYIIPKDGEPIEIIGKKARSRAINKAISIYLETSDKEIIIQQFDDSSSDGYMANLECLHISQLLSQITI